MSYLTIQELEGLPTPRLLAYRRSLMNRRRWFTQECECWNCTNMKSLEETIESAKLILNTREHISDKA